MKKFLIIGISLVFICLGLTIYNEFINGPVNLYTITNSGKKVENKKVYLDITFVAGTITDDNENGYYVMFGDGVQYIVYINKVEASKINRYLLDNPEASYRIDGITKLVPTNLEENGKKFVKTWLDNNHNHEEEKVEEGHTHDITTEEFYHYFGYVYLDVNKGFDIVRLFIYLTGILGLLSIFNYFNTKYHFIG